MAWVSGVIGFVSFVRLLFYFTKFYLSAGDEEKMKNARMGIYYTLAFFVASLIVGYLAFDLMKS